MAVIYSIRSLSRRKKEERKSRSLREGTLEGRTDGPHISCQMSAAAGAEISRPLPPSPEPAPPGIDRFDGIGPKPCVPPGMQRAILLLHAASSDDKVLRWNDCSKIEVMNDAFFSCFCQGIDRLLCTLVKSNCNS